MNHYQRAIPLPTASLSSSQDIKRDRVLLAKGTGQPGIVRHLRLARAICFLGVSNSIRNCTTRAYPSGQKIQQLRRAFSSFPVEHRLREITRYQTRCWIRDQLFRPILNFVERRNIERLRFGSRKSRAFVSSFRILAMGRRNFDRLEIRRSSAVSFLIPRMGDESSWLLVTLDDSSAMDVFSSIGKRKINIRSLVFIVRTLV